MSQTDRLERELIAWFGATASPRTSMDVDDLMSLVVGTSQRPGWSFPARWVPASVASQGQRVSSRIPWRTAALIAVLAVLLAGAVAVYVGADAARLPEPYGVARNGLVAFAERGDIVVVDPATGARTATIDLEAVRLAGPRFSRDGTRLAFRHVSADGGSTIYVAGADGSDPRPITTAPVRLLEGYEWAPDGRSMLLRLRATEEGPAAAMAVLSTDGTGRLVPIDVGTSVDMARWRPPDGQEIIFRGRSDTEIGLFAIRPDGTGLRPIVSTDLAAPTDPMAECQYPGDVPGQCVVGSWEPFAYSTSPDGSTIAFAGTEPLRVYLVPTEGGQRQAITTAEAGCPVWSPDGRWIAYCDLEPFTPLYLAGPMTGRLAVIGVDGERQPGIPDGAMGGTTTWTPDGTRIIVSSGPWQCQRTQLGCRPEGGQVLFDPFGGPSALPPWSGDADWQRLAP